MRDPRFRFGDDVRAATREMSGRMSKHGVSPQSAGELESWLGENPDIHQRLTVGGYGDRFSAEDLFPLLHVFLSQHVPPPAPVRHPVRALSWPVAIGLIVLLALLIWAAMGGTTGL